MKNQNIKSLKSIKFIDTKDFFYFSFQLNSSHKVILGFTKLGYQNPEELKNIYPFSRCKLAYLHQTHSSKINFVKEYGCYQGDGIFTQQDNLVLAIKTADCLPVYFFVPEHEIIGLIHLGWRSAKKGILEKLNFLKSHTYIFVVAGVGLRKCCYQVGNEFLKYQRLSSFLSFEKNKLFFDPISFLYHTLKSYKINHIKLYDLNICSFCDIRFPSWRREKTFKRTLSFIFKDKTNQRKNFLNIVKKTNGMKNKCIKATLFQF